MFAVKPRIEIVFRILMAAAILLSAPLNVFSVKADDVTVTPTQVSSATPTAEPTVTPTDTPVPPVTETPLPATEMTGPSATPAPVETLPPTDLRYAISTLSPRRSTGKCRSSASSDSFLQP